MIMDGLDARGNPRRSMWLAAYGAAIVMGLLYLTDVAQTRALAGTTDSFAAYTWQWSLFIGGIVAMIGNMMPRWRFRTALPIEAAGTLTISIMLWIYVGVLAYYSVNTTGMPWATVVWMTSIAIATGGRFFEAMNQRRRAIAYAMAKRAIAQQVDQGETT